MVHDRNLTSDQTDVDTIDLRDLFALLLDEWRWIVAITLAVFFCAAVYAFTATPVYRTNALVQVEEKESGIGGIEELSSMLSGETPTEAEIEIIKSRSVLLQAIEKEDLNIKVEPLRFPLIGGAMARNHEGDAPAEAWLGFDSYAWGGEQVQVDRLETGRELEGEELTLVAGENNTFALLGLDGEELVTGTVGEAAEGDAVSVFIPQLVARPGTRFTLVYHAPLVTLQGLRERLSVAERGKQTGILELSLEGEDREKIASTLNTIANIYLRQNVERKSAEAAKTLEFLNEQLPELKAELHVAEQALNQFRVEKGSVDLTLETQGLLEQLAEVEKRASELELQQAELMQRFTAEHPAMQALNQQQAEVAQTRAQLEQQIRELPQAEQDALRLMRDVRVANELYMLLLNRAQELKVVEAGTVGNVRIIDTAFVPREPVKPKKSLVLALGLVLGGMLGVFAVFLRQALATGIRDPKVLEQAFNLPVYAIVPRSAAEMRSGSGKGAQHLIAVDDPLDPAVESLRSLRTSVQFLMQEAASNVVAIGGPAPEVGKSFVSANLAVLMAQVGHRVLVMDADLRRGHLHRKFGRARGQGLSDVIVGDADLESVIVPASGTDKLFFLSSGTLPPNPAELIVSRRMETLVQELAGRYDMVILDAPPILAASEAVTLAHLAGLNLMVVRSGQQNQREVELAVERLRQTKAELKGFIFNDLTVGSRRYAYAGYRYYRYEQA